MRCVPPDGLVLHPCVRPGYVAEFGALQTQSGVDFLRPEPHEHRLSAPRLLKANKKSGWFAQTWEVNHHPN